LPLALAGAPSELTIDGGTHVSASPCYHFLETTWLRYMELLGLKIGLQMRRPGFYPRGGGLLQAHIGPCARLEGLKDFHHTAATAVTGFSAVAGLPEHVARRQAEHAVKRLKKELGLHAHIAEESWPGGPGSVLALILNTGPVPTLFFALGERGKPAERVADEAVAQVVRFHKAGSGPAGAGVDEHSADQLLLPLSWASGASKLPVAEISSHLMTNVSVIRQFVDRNIAVEGGEGGPGVVHVEQ
jgi:RNA 3'-phosphate cyclase